MCSKFDDIEDESSSDILYYPTNESKLNLLTNCKKCGSIGSVTLRVKDVYCDLCFITNTNHKFRASLGKTKIIQQNPPVLLALSGGLGSTILLDLVYNGIRLDTHKKLRIRPQCFHIIDCLSADVTRHKQIDAAQKIIDVCLKYELDVYIVHMSIYSSKEFDLPLKNVIPNVEDAKDHYLLKLVNRVSPTARNDFIAKIKRTLFIRVAEKLNCNIIFTAETTTTIAANMLSDLVVGRGSQIEHDVSFCDFRNTDVKILRPLKDISNEELNYYSYIGKITPVCNTDLHENSLQSVIKTFVTDLQQNYQSTISTVCKTGEKLGVHNNEAITESPCIICQSALDTQRGQSSALQATIFSRMVSSVHPQNFDEVALMREQNVARNEDSENKSNFHENLCYGCRLTFSEMNICDYRKLMNDNI